MQSAVAAWSAWQAGVGGQHQHTEPTAASPPHLLLHVSGGVTQDGAQGAGVPGVSAYAGRGRRQQKQLESRDEGTAAATGRSVHATCPAPALLLSAAAACPRQPLPVPPPHEPVYAGAGPEHGL